MFLGSATKMRARGDASSRSATELVLSRRACTGKQFKTEVVGLATQFRARPLSTFDGVEYATMEWVDWYNNRRLSCYNQVVKPLIWLTSLPRTRSGIESFSASLERPHRKSPPPARKTSREKPKERREGLARDGLSPQHQGESPGA